MRDPADILSVWHRRLVKEARGRRERTKVTEALLQELAGVLYLGRKTLAEYMSARDGRLRRYLKEQGRKTSLKAVAFYSTRLNGLPRDEVRVFLSEIDAGWLPITLKDERTCGITFLETNADKHERLERHEVGDLMTLMATLGPMAKVMRELQKKSFYKRMLHPAVRADSYRWMAELCQGAIKSLEYIESPARKHVAQAEIRHYCRFLAAYYLKSALEEDASFESEQHSLRQSIGWLQRELKAIDGALATYDSWAEKAVDVFAAGERDENTKRLETMGIEMIPNLLRQEHQNALKLLESTKRLKRDAANKQRWLEQRLDVLPHDLGRITHGIGKARGQPPKLKHPMEHFGDWLHDVTDAAKRDKFDDFPPRSRDALAKILATPQSSAVPWMYDVLETALVEFGKGENTDLTECPPRARELVAFTFASIALVRLADFALDVRKLAGKTPEQCLAWLDANCASYQSFLYSLKEARVALFHLSAIGKLKLFKKTHQWVPQLIRSWNDVFDSLWAILVPDADPAEIVSVLYSLDAFYRRGRKARQIPPVPVYEIGPLFGVPTSTEADSR